MDSLIEEHIIKPIRKAYSKKEEDYCTLSRKTDRSGEKDKKMQSG